MHTCAHAVGQPHKEGTRKLPQSWAEWRDDRQRRRGDTDGVRERQSQESSARALARPAPKQPLQAGPGPQKGKFWVLPGSYPQPGHSPPRDPGPVPLWVSACPERQGKGRETPRALTLQCSGVLSPCQGPAPTSPQAPHCLQAAPRAQGVSEDSAVPLPRSFP